MLISLGLCLTSFTEKLYIISLSQKFPLPTSSFFNLENGISILEVDKENSVPTWFSSSVLLLCSVLLATIASVAKRARERYVLHWATLSIIFVVLSMDEVVSGHEMSIEPLRSLLDTGGLLYFAWIIPGGAFVVVFVLAYLRFLFSLPAETRRQFVVAGALYVLGALGLEILGGLQSDLYGESNLTYAAITTVEELLEMIGSALFLYALMRYTGHLEKAGE